MVTDIFPIEDSSPLEIFDRNCILLLDSNREYLEKLSRCFKQQQFKVLSHTLGELGLQTARRVGPDCVVVNSELLDMDGFDLCRSLVDQSSTCGIPVIMIGQSETSDIIGRAKSAGCVYFVAKPIDPKTLVLLVNESIAEARSWICE